MRQAKQYLATLPLGWRTAFAATMVLLGAACMEGYPQADEPIPSPFDMTPAQRMAKMNDLGRNAHPERNWQYEMRPGCVLRVDMDGPDGPRPPVDIPLLGAVIELAHDRADQTFDINVLARPAAAAHTPPSLLESLRWSDASVMLLLVRVVQLSCASDHAPTQ